MTELEPLLDRARAGDLEAWRALLQRLRPMLWAVCRRQVRDDADASDLTQDVLLRMDQRFPQFRGQSVQHLLAWARRIAARLVIDHGRAAPPATEGLPVDLPVREVEGPSWKLARLEDAARLAEALLKLPAHYRAVIEARLFGGLSCVAIGQQMGQSAVWVRVTCKRAVERLRMELRDQP
jgi:RNA polymerase sigma-70 factor (ECF subfamily)